LLPNPHAFSASFNLVGSPFLLSNEPFIPPNLAAKLTLLGLVPDLTGAFKLEPSVLLKKAANIAKASGVPNKEKAGTVSREAAIEIAKIKMEDLNTDDVEQALKIVQGTARSMGIDIG